MRKILQLSVLILAVNVPAVLGDTTDREHLGTALRHDSDHTAAWTTLLSEQESASGGFGSGFRPSGCSAADRAKPECQIERDNDSGGGDSH